MYLSLPLAMLPRCVWVKAVGAISSEPVLGLSFGPGNGTRLFRFAMPAQCAAVGYCQQPSIRSKLELR
jgi:hypothetical protein